MDPHMTAEDRNIMDLGSHRRLKQELTPPPCPQHFKKKKLVNFKVSLRRRSLKDQARRGSTGSITPRFDGRKSSVTFLQDQVDALGNVKDCAEHDIPLQTRHDSRTATLERQDTRTTKERREAFRSTGEQRMAARRSQDRRSGSTANSFSLSRDQEHRFEDQGSRDMEMTRRLDLELSRATQRNLSVDTGKRHSLVEPDLSPIRTTPPRTSPRTTPTRTTPIRTSPNVFCPPNDTSPTPLTVPTAEEIRRLNNIAAQRKREDFSRSISTSSTENWNKIKTVATPRTTRMNSLVEMVITRRKASLAPSIWTPSVPRSSPGPRPANFQDQEEKGKSVYVVSFILHTAPVKQRQHVRFRRLPSLQLPEREVRGKQYLAWLGKLVENPLLSSGILLKGLEIGVEYPVIHLRDVPEGGVGGGEQRRLEASLGSDSSLLQAEYEEVVSWTPELLVTCPSDPSQWARCYIILGFMTLDGELNEKMEKVWKEWTGALFIYCNIDDDLGLKKLSFYRRRSPHQAKLFSYLVIVEIDTVTRKNSLHLLDFVYRMRLRSMSGYISVYQSHSPEVEVERKGSVSCISNSSSSSSLSSSVQAERAAVSTTTILPEYQPDVYPSSRYGRMSV
ncbi:uncharacterized protein LOC123502095 [Portunus trituberculatus]|uniref:uncharacterized protein LOC123502095 n=1 Tax=Portunus trituberculatus TaxID=210409 RepID=UPI001E1CB30D|nr:uncharacterized protein LOC123502095 [Portunus trituberculatus]XP_045107222.1 uncharacterized protein LOC123502095 [Portunus trituberculatus]XP_045107223.1 uncharacterized protein LOC123502095 [Portunus trituberculatus]